MQELEKILEEIDIKISGSMGRKREGLLEARDIIRKHMNDGWIPVEKRLPEKEYDTVLCVTDQNYYLICVYNKEIGFRISDFLVEGEIVAWRPLPDLYQPEIES